ncbi:hypothetical protein Tco_0485790, partial [Tanacetum coccineum]
MEGVIEEDMDLDDEIEEAEEISPYEDVDPLNPPPPNSDFEFKDEALLFSYHPLYVDFLVASMLG